MSLVFDVEPEYQLLEFWKRAEGTFPMVAEMAREFLAIPASGVGVERLFNQARDICTYRRHRVKPETLRLLVMLMCMDSFNLKEEYRLSRAANDVEDEWEQASGDDDDNDDDDNQSIYAISENDEDLDPDEDATVYPQDMSVFDMLEDDVFGVPHMDMFELPDDPETVLQEFPIFPEANQKPIVPVAVVIDTTIPTTPPGQRQRQPTSHLTTSVTPMTRQRCAALQVASRRSTRCTQQL
jgi:hypothetical protein